MLESILFVAALAIAYITIVFVVAQVIGRMDIVDVAWGGAFIVIALSSYMFGSGGALQTLVTVLVLVWGIRLGYYIFRRILNSKKEDERYSDMRKKWRENVAVNAYFRVFLVQGLLAVVISASVIAINLYEPTALDTFFGANEIGVAALFGTLLWLVGFWFEAVGDAQLKAHLANPENKGKLMTSGLWRYTRHPNYFGEATQWWGIWVISLSVPLGWMTIIAPLTITLLLVYVTGVPLTEQRFEGRKGWKEYRARTSKFLPLPPKTR